MNQIESKVHPGDDLLRTEGAHEAMLPLVLQELPAVLLAFLKVSLAEDGVVNEVAGLAIRPTLAQQGLG